MTKWSDWCQSENSHYIIYPYLYSEKLINLCWYWWGGGLYPYRPLRVSSLSEILTNGVQSRAILFIICDLICYYTNNLLPTKPISSVFNICINRGKIYSVVLIVPFLFAHTNQLGKSLFVIIWFVTTVFICREIALIQYFYIIIHVIHLFQHCLSQFAYYSLCSLNNSCTG